MPIAAVPHYLRDQPLASAAPGLRFGMYLQAWGVDTRSQQPLWTLEDRGYKTSGPDKREREVAQNNKRSAFDSACQLHPDDVARLQALLARQTALAGPLLAAGRLLCLHTQSMSPFTTGLGLEHPLENGFSFLDPYGLPYLPGSGIKGVLRDAASLELGWDDEAVAALFGAPDVRGALQFWDVLPQVANNRLLVDVMTPHQTHYYQRKGQRNGTSASGPEQAPHDSGQPNPIHFLTVPPGSTFVFHVACDVAHLKKHAAALAEGGLWQQRVAEAFDLAFEWLGFGAKTAVGYGALRRDEQQERAAAALAQRQAQQLLRAEQDKQLTAAQRVVRDYADKMAQRAEQLAGRKTAVGQAEYGDAQALVKQAQGAEWTAADRAAAADAIEQWAPRLINLDAKDLRKKLRLNELRTAG